MKEYTGTATDNCTFSEATQPMLPSGEEEEKEKEEEVTVGIVYMLHLPPGILAWNAATAVPTTLSPTFDINFEFPRLG
jgi:hypothetical protein